MPALDLQTFLMVVNVIVGLGDMIVGIVSLVKLDKVTYSTCQCVENRNAAFAVAMLAVITVVFGLIIILSQFKPVVLVNRMFLGNIIMLGVFMILVGLMCMGIAGDLGLAWAIVSFFFGLFQIILYFFSRSEAAPHH